MNAKIRFLAYLGAGFFFFIFFLFATFPTDVLETRIINQIEESLGNNYQLKIGKSSVSLFTGFVFKNVELNQRGGEKNINLLTAQKLKINPSLLSLLRRKLDLSFYLKTNHGEVEGGYSEDSSKSKIELEFDDFNFSELKFLTAIYHLPLNGILNGEANFSLSKKGTDKNNGKLDLKFENLQLDHFYLNLDPENPEAMMEFPKVQLTGSKNSKIIGELKKNSLEIKELTFKGGDLDLSLKGQLILAENPENSQINLEGSLKINPTLTGQIPLLALVEQQKESDGSYRLKISGRLTQPSITVGNFRLPL